MATSRQSGLDSLLFPAIAQQVTASSCASAVAKTKHYEIIKVTIVAYLNSV